MGSPKIRTLQTQEFLSDRTRARALLKSADSGSDSDLKQCSDLSSDSTTIFLNTFFRCKYLTQKKGALFASLNGVSFATKSLNILNFVYSKFEYTKFKIFKFSLKPKIHKKTT